MNPFWTRFIFYFSRFSGFMVGYVGILFGISIAVAYLIGYSSDLAFLVSKLEQHWSDLILLLIGFPLVFTWMAIELEKSEILSR